jgi:hypothetical protein
LRAYLGSADTLEAPNNTTNANTCGKSKFRKSERYRPGERSKKKVRSLISTRDANETLPTKNEIMNFLPFHGKVRVFNIRMKVGQRSQHLS